MTHAQMKQEKRNVPIRSLRLPDGFNVRTGEIPKHEVEWIATSIEQQGLIHDVSVEEGEEGGDRVYYVTSGFGRAAALLHLQRTRGWDKDQEVTVTVVTYANRVDPLIRNLAENIVKRDVRTADLAKRLYELHEGASPDPRGGFVTTRVSVKRLAEELQLGEGPVREYIRAWKKSCPELRMAWRGEQVRTDHVRSWCKLDDDAQRAKLAAHLAGEDELKAKAKARAAAVEEDEEGEADDKPAKRKARDEDDEAKAPTRSEVAAKLEALGKRLDAGGGSATEKAALRGRWEALRWVLGDVRRLGAS